MIYHEMQWRHTNSFTGMYWWIIWILVKQHLAEKFLSLTSLGLSIFVSLHSVCHKILGGGAEGGIMENFQSAEGESCQASGDPEFGYCRLQQDRTCGTRGLVEHPVSRSPRDHRPGQLQVTICYSRCVSVNPCWHHDLKFAKSVKPTILMVS